MRVAGAMERFPETMLSMGVSSETLDRYLLPAVGLEQIRELHSKLEAEAAERAVATGAYNYQREITL